MFANCKELKTVTLNEGLVTLSGFAGCTALERIEIPSTVKTMGYRAFAGCTALKEVTLPQGLSTVGDRAFAEAYALSQIVIPAGVSEMGGYVFDGCIALKTIRCEAEKLPAGWQSGWAGGCKAEILWGEQTA